MYPQVKHRMWRCLALVMLAVCLVSSGISYGTAYADEGPATILKGLSLAPSSASVQTGGTVSVEIQAQEARNVYGFDLIFSFDSEYLEFDSANPVAVLNGSFGVNGQNGVLAYEKLDDHRIKLVGSRLEPQNGLSGNKVGLVTVKLKAKGKTGTAGFQVMAEADFADKNLVVQTTDKAYTGQVTVTSGGGGGIYVPPPSNSATGDAPVDEALEEGPYGIILYEKDTDVTTYTNELSKQATNYTVKSLRLQKAFEILAAKPALYPRVTVLLNEKSPVTQVRFPADILLKGKAGKPSAEISVQTGAATYHLPVKLLELTEWAKDAGIELKDLFITIKLEKPDDELKAMIREAAKKEAAEVVYDGIGLSVLIEAGGNKKEFSDFGSTYVTRTLYVGEELAPAETSAVQYDPINKQLVFVPAVLEVNTGMTSVHIQRPVNSIYAVIHSKKSFTDLEGHWSKAEVELMASKLVAKGTADHRFLPDGKVTRAEFTAMLIRALGLEETNSASMKYKDVRYGAWYYGAIGAAVKAGLIDGYKDGFFRPSAPVTRSEMVTLISRGIKFAGRHKDVAAEAPSILGAYKDADRVPAFAREAFAETVDAKIVYGMKGNRLAPSEQATRAQAAAILKRMLQYLTFINPN